MKKCRTGLPLAFAALTFALASGAVAQEPGAEQERYVVGHALPPVDPGKTLISLTLDEAIARALETNLDIQSIRLNPEIQEYSMIGARAAFATNLSATLGYSSSTSQSTSQLDGGTRTTSQRQQFNFSANKPLPFWGARLSASFNNSRTETNNRFATRNPSYSSSFSLNYSQPLLAGLKIDNQRASLETQEIQSQIVDLQVETQIENITNNVRQAYWSLRAAIEQLEIQRRNLAQARRLLEENRTRVQLGRMTELQLVQAEAQVASAEQSMLNAEIQWRNSEFAFKRLLLTGADDPLLQQTVNPTTLPEVVDSEIDIEAATQRALRERADIRQQRQQREISLINFEVTKSNRLPDLTLSASYSLSGVGGNLFERSGLGGEPILVQRGGYLDGLQSIADFDTPTWNISVNASYPVGMNAAQSSLERARLQLRQSELALRAQELSILTQVTTAALAVRNSYLQLEAARRNREMAERNAEAEMLRFQVGVSTNYEVTSAQNSLTSARLSELQATISHVNAVAEFERVQRIGG